MNHQFGVLEDEEDILHLIRSIEREKVGSESDFWDLGRHDQNMCRIIARGFPEEMAWQIFNRFRLQDFDYVEEEGGVISGVFFPGKYAQKPEVSLPFGQGRESLTYSLLQKVGPETLVRPKLPGYLCQSLCGAYAEKVGNVYYALQEQKCQCCTSHDFVKLKDFVDRDWYEGIMVQLDGQEFRVRRYLHHDKIVNNKLWEVEYRGDEQVLIKPRGSIKMPTKLRPLPVMRSVIEAEQVRGVLTNKQHASKAYVWTGRGWTFEKKENGFNQWGGKSLNPQESYIDIMTREYQEETGHVIPFDFLDFFETDQFITAVYVAVDLFLPESGNMESTFELGPNILHEQVMLKYTEKELRIAAEKGVKFMKGWKTRLELGMYQASSIKKFLEKSGVTVDYMYQLGVLQKTGYRAEYMFMDVKLPLPVLAVKGQKFRYHFTGKLQHLEKKIYLQGLSSLTFDELNQVYGLENFEGYLKMGKILEIPKSPILLAAYQERGYTVTGYEDSAPKVFKPDKLEAYYGTTSLSIALMMEGLRGRLKVGERYKLTRTGAVISKDGQIPLAWMFVDNG